jgi:class 3 adenylate cyclase
MPFNKMAFLSITFHQSGSRSRGWVKFLTGKQSPMKKVILLAVIIYQSSFMLCYAQQTNLDSLYTVWQDPAQPDSNRVKAYNDFIWYGYIFSKPDTAGILAEALHAYAGKHRYPNASGRGYQLQGIANYLQGNYPIALEYLQKSLEIFEELGEKQGIAKSLDNIGLIYKLQGNYPRALEYLERALVIREELGDQNGIAINLGNTGGVYFDQGNYPRALENLQKSLAFYEEVGHKEGIAASMSNIASIYSEQGNIPRALIYLEKSQAIMEEIGNKRGIANILGSIGPIYNEQGNYSRALECLHESLAIYEEIGNKTGMALNLHMIGRFYSQQSDYSRALEYLETALKLAEEIGDRSLNASGLITLGELFQKQGKYSGAIDYCKRGMTLAEEIGVLDVQKSACECLYNTYKAIGKGNEALVYLEKMNVINDSLNSEETAKKLQQMEFAKIMLQDSIAQAETDRLVSEAHQEEMRAEEKTRNIALGAGGFLLLLAGALYTRVRYVRKSKAVLQVEKDRSENLLLNILPADIAKELKEKGKADARDFDMVSILFTDFKGFTEQSAKLSAAVLVNEINSCFEAFDSILEKYGIEKIKTIGDAYMAAGGLPVPSDDSVKNTLLAALEMQAFITSRKAENDAAHKPGFEMRVGVHTGPVVAGIVGVKKFQYDIWGDTVNTASRIESVGEVGKVNISHSTYELLKNDPQFSFESRGKVMVKGKGEIEMFFVSKS